MAEKGMIETGVDDLLRLVETSGKVSVPEIAKKLEVEQKTVETWVDFLVEEEKLSVEYKFTTPYVFLNKEKKEEKEDDLSISEEDFESEIQQEESAIDSTTMEYNDFVARLNKMFKEMHSLLKEGRVDEAYKDYSELCVLVSRISNSEMADIFNRNLIKLNDALLQILKKHREQFPDILKELSVLEEQGKTLLDQGQVEQAKGIYQKMKAYYDHTPSMLMEEKTRIYDRISAFYKIIIDKEHELSESVVDDARRKIADIKQQVADYLRQDRIEEAQQYLQPLNSIYASLPSDLVSYKIQVYNEILKIYQEIKIASKFAQLREDLKSIGSTIELPSMSSLLPTVEKPHATLPPSSHKDDPMTADHHSTSLPEAPHPLNNPASASVGDEDAQTKKSVLKDAPHVSKPADDKNAAEPGKLPFHPEKESSGILSLLKHPGESKEKNEKKDELTKTAGKTPKESKEIESKDKGPVRKKGFGIPPVVSHHANGQQPPSPAPPPAPSAPSKREEHNMQNDKHLVMPGQPETVAESHGNNAEEKKADDKEEHSLFSLHPTYHMRPKEDASASIPAGGQDPEQEPSGDKTAATKDDARPEQRWPSREEALEKELPHPTYHLSQNEQPAETATEKAPAAQASEKKQEEDRKQGTAKEKPLHHAPVQHESHLKEALLHPIEAKHAMLGFSSKKKEKDEELEKKESKESHPTYHLSPKADPDQSTQAQEGFPKQKPSLETPKPPVRSFKGDFPPPTNIKKIPKVEHSTAEPQDPEKIFTDEEEFDPLKEIPAHDAVE
ncbi:MAG: hypothetical protein ACOC32_01090, partial [Nanoarchaeota archaeon]